MSQLEKIIVVMSFPVFKFFVLDLDYDLHILHRLF
jgi:hypothetical protein